MDFNLTKPRIVIDHAGDTVDPGRTGGAAAGAVAVLVAVAVISHGGAASDGPAGSGARAAPGAGGAGAGAPPVRVRRRVHAMGTVLTATAWSEGRATAVEGLEAAVRSVEEAEDRLSTWRDDTALSELNAAPPGRPAAVDDRLLRLLRDVRRWHEATGGAFDPGVGRLVDAWDLRGEGRVPDPEELRDARAASGMACWRLDPDGGTVTPRCEGAWIDAGAFGKGAAFRDAGRALRDAGVRAALLDFGGQILAVGRPPGRTGWPVGVAHPSRREESVATLRVADLSVATTSASERFVEVDGRPRGHVLDPRTGEPVEPWGSVTVVADDPMAADALSTALFVLGPGRALRWADGREDVGVLVLAETGDGPEGRWNDAMERHLDDAPEP